MTCPECKCEMDNYADVCDNCGFDLKMFKESYNKIYTNKLNNYNKEEDMKNAPQVQIIKENDFIHLPRCPYCGSTDLHKITSVDKVVNIALFGLFGNKRRYQWHCNNCKTNW